MTSPTCCPKCQAAFPESLEWFGANCACRACGQILKPDGLPRPSPPPVFLDDDDEEEDEESLPIPLPPLDQLMSEGWQIFRERMGLCIGVFLLAQVLQLVAQLPELYVNLFVINRPLPPETKALLSIGMSIVTLVRVAFSIWLSIGMYQFALKIVRGQTAGVGDLFGGGRFFWRALLCSIVFGLAILGGLLLFIVPGIIAILMFWPFLYVLVDRNLPGLQSLSQASMITSGNKLALFGLLLVCTFINVCGLLALGVGIFVSVPYVFVVTTLAYDRISGISKSRRPSDPDDAVD
jgi:hypothetical protein